MRHSFLATGIDGVAATLEVESRLETEHQLQCEKDKKEGKARAAAFERESARLTAKAARLAQADAKRSA